METVRKDLAFGGRLVMIGFGCIGQGVLPLLLRHIEMQAHQILIIGPDHTDMAVASSYGVPCLVSDHVGCQRDLVTDGETGWVFRAGDPAQLREKLTAAFAADLPAFRHRVAARIAGYTYATATAGLLAALQSL